MALRLPIGISDFRKLREQEAEYVDKSHLIVEILDRATEVLLLPRPRRFGKTVNLSMLRYFFEKQPEDLSYLFDDLAIWRAGDVYRKHFQRYPVIFLTLREIKASSFEACWAELRKTIQTLFREHQALLSSSVLDEGETADYRAILDGTAEPVLYRRALGALSEYLHRATKERVVILIDEYDAPIHAGFIHGYVREVVEFLRRFLSGGLKDNPHLERGVVTGILRVARESIFSGLNNLGVYTLLQRAFSTCFGFTEPEVTVLLQKAGREGAIDRVRGWYNGYDFGGTVIYNPWSVLCYLGDEEAIPKPYWLNTSSNDLIKAALEKHGPRLQPTLEALLRGEGFEAILDENVGLDRIDQSDATLFGLLVFSGYLRAELRPRGEMDQAAYHLSIPNREVRLVYTTTFQEWFEARLRGHGGDQGRLTAALLSGDVEGFERQLGAFVKNVLSYHDLRAPNKTSRCRPAETRRPPALLGLQRARARFRPRALAGSRLFARLGPVLFGALSSSFALLAHRAAGLDAGSGAGSPSPVRPAGGFCDRCDAMGSQKPPPGTKNSAGSRGFSSTKSAKLELSADEPERIYQAFLLGLFTVLEPGHRVRSNRESGKGRPDVMILPTRPGSPGVVLELKVARGRKTLEMGLDEGAGQIREREYRAELDAAGAEPVHLLVIAFDGKEVRVRGVEPS